MSISELGLKFKDSTMKELFILKIVNKDLKHLLKRENQVIMENDTV